MITDAFIFFNELDMLRLRLVELYPVVDQFILVESDKTFRGAKKPFTYQERKGLFEPWNDKIKHVRFLMPDDITDPWAREKYSRAKIEESWEPTSDDDILIFSDTDEIVRREIVPTLDPQPIQAIETQNFSVYINAREGKGHAIKAIRPAAFDMGPIQYLREHRDDPLVPDGGWSFSSIGDPEFISTKLQSFSHSEYDVAEYTSPKKIAERMRTLTDLLDRGTLTRVEVDDTWPHEVIDNREYWNKFIYERA